MLRLRPSHLAHALCVGCGFSRALRRVNRQKLLILMYHRLHAEPIDPLENFDGLSVHRDNFIRQMRYVARHYQVVSFADCLNRSGSFPYRAAIAFDDGYASVYQYAYPVLRALGLQATVFVPTDFIEGKILMWWDHLRRLVSTTAAQEGTVSHRGQQRVFPLRTYEQKEQMVRELGPVLRRLTEGERTEILTALTAQLTASPETLPSAHGPLSLAHLREMAQHGIAVGSHGKTHRAFPTLTTEELWQEVSESKALLENWLGRPVTWLAYPFGEVDERVLHLLPRAGYQGAVTTRYGLSNGEGPFVLRRIAVGGQTTFPQFVTATSGVRELVSRFETRRERAAKT